MRTYLDGNGFVDLETPMLTKATPEGARDYPVPSRTHPGKFFALPQSPQIFKQLLMMAGFDRYYQIVRCFRDEDLRADRQPEFTQLDIETSFLTQEDIMKLMEGLMRHLFKEVMNVELPNPLPRMPYSEAMRRYGSDKPDLRISLELVDVADLVKDCEFKVFAGPAKDPKGRVTALRVPGGNSMSRSQIDDYTRVCRALRREGSGVHQGGRDREGSRWPAVADHQVPERRCREGHLCRAPARSMATSFSSARTASKVVSDALGALRLRVGHDLKLVRERVEAAVGDRLPDVRVRPGSEALGGDASPVHLAGERRSGRVEGGSGERALEGLRHGAERLGDRWWLGAYPPPGNAVHRVRAARYRCGRGAVEVRLPARCAEVRRAASWRYRVRPRSPHHADGGADSIREVIAFPKTQTAADPLTDAPTAVSEAQLRGLHIRVRQQTRRQ